MVFSELGFN